MNMTKVVDGVVVEMSAEEVAEYKETMLKIKEGNWKSNREGAYPSIEEQLDMMYWDSVNGTTTWADAIAKVKTDFPK